MPEARRGQLQGNTPVVRASRSAAPVGGAGTSSAWECLPDGRVAGGERELGGGRGIPWAHTARARGGRSRPSAHPCADPKRPQGGAAVGRKQTRTEPTSENSVKGKSKSSSTDFRRFICLKSKRCILVTVI